MFELRSPPEAEVSLFKYSYIFDISGRKKNCIEPECKKALKEVPCYISSGRKGDGAL